MYVKIALRIGFLVAAIIALIFINVKKLGRI